MRVSAHVGHTNKERIVVLRVASKAGLVHGSLDAADAATKYNQSAVQKRHDVIGTLTRTGATRSRAVDGIDLDPVDLGFVIRHHKHPHILEIVDAPNAELAAPATAIPESGGIREGEDLNIYRQDGKKESRRRMKEEE